MNQIRYNEKEEAYEITYKIWEKEITVRFYVGDQQEIMDNLSDIAQKLDKLGKGREKICEIISDDGFYEGHAETLAKNIEIVRCYVDIDEDGVVVCFTVDSRDGYLNALNMELYGDDFEIVGYD